MATEASRGIELSHHRRIRKCSLQRTTPQPTVLRTAQPSVQQKTHRQRHHNHHEISETQHLHGPRLNIAASSSVAPNPTHSNSADTTAAQLQYGSSAPVELHVTPNIYNNTSDISIEEVDTGDNLDAIDSINWINSDADVVVSEEEEEPLTYSVANGDLRRSPSSSFNRHSIRQLSITSNSNSRIRRSSIRKSSNNKRASARHTKSDPSWHIKTADKFLRAAEAQDVKSSDIVICASALLEQRMQAIKNEQLVLDWDAHKPRDEVEILERIPQISELECNNYTNEAELQEKFNVQKLNESNQVIGVPVSAFKWPGNNNNKRKRLAEIKKQVKLLSSIIKMTIEGAHEQHSSHGGEHAGGFSNPAPFSPFVDMASIAGGALTSASGEEAFLPSIDDLADLLRVNKLKEAKSLLRGAGGAVTCPTRPILWKDLCKRQTTEQFSDSFYFDTLLQIYGTKDLNDCRVVLPAFVDSHHLGRGLTPAGEAACGRIITVLAYYYPPITHAPALHPLAACLLFYMSECDVYNSLSALICSSKVTFATQTKIAHEVSWRTTMVLAKKHVGGGFSTLEKYGVDSQQVEAAFQNWLWWIFEGIPIQHMIRVLDCFLLEGWKVLVRVGLAIFQLYLRQVSRDPSMAAQLSTKGLPEAIMRFCQSMTITPAKLLKTAFGIRALSKSEIQKVMSRTEQSLKRKGGVATGADAHGVQSTHEDMTGLRRAVSIEGLPTTSAQGDVQMFSHTLNVKELLTIWNWLPVRMTMYQPRLLYTTEEHGSSLTTFYRLVEHHEQTILLVRTTCDQVFGAYCSTPWSSRNTKDEYGHKRTFYGTGETFLFTLRPVPSKYQWVGITQQQNDSALSHVKHSSELFMHGDDEMITIGGGERQGLMLDHELRFGKTDSCQTFDNRPLCDNKDFEIKVVEVYGIDVTNS